MHDDLLAKLPKDSIHDETACPVCLAAAGAPIQEEASVTQKTDAELAADTQRAITEATAPLLAELEQLRESQSAAAQEAKLAEVREPLEARIAELETALEVETNKVAALEAQWTEAVAALEAADVEAKEAAAAIARADEREAAIKEVASFKDDYYTADRKAKWAGMEQDAFDDLLAQITESASAAGGQRREVLRPTAMTAAEQAAGKGARTTHMRAAQELRLRGHHADQI